MQAAVLSVRVNPANPNHHLYNNNGTWWCHYTVHLPDFTKQRVRVSLETNQLPVARSRRNGLLSQITERGLHC
jgi:hypothetical protein